MESVSAISQLEHCMGMLYDIKTELDKHNAKDPNIRNRIKRVNDLTNELESCVNDECFRIMKDEKESDKKELCECKKDICYKVYENPFKVNCTTTCKDEKCNKDCCCKKQDEPKPRVTMQSNHEKEINESIDTINKKMRTLESNLCDIELDLWDDLEDVADRVAMLETRFKRLSGQVNEIREQSSSCNGDDVIMKLFKEGFLGLTEDDIKDLCKKQ